MAEFQGDTFSDIVSADVEVPTYLRYTLWARWDRDFSHRRFKLKWGFFRSSFRYFILEPLIEKFIGPRP